MTRKHKAKYTVSETQTASDITRYLVKKTGFVVQTSGLFSLPDITGNDGKS